MLNFNSKTLDDLAAKIGKAVEASPAKDIEKNVKAMLQGGLSKLDVVPRSEFETRLAAVPKVERHVLSPAGHMLHHDQPQALARRLEEFLDTP